MSGLTLRSSRRAAVRWPGAEAPRATQVQVSVRPARGGRARLSERTMGGLLLRIYDLGDARIRLHARRFCHDSRHERPGSAVAADTRWPERTRSAGAHATGSASLSAEVGRRVLRCWQLTHGSRPARVPLLARDGTCS